MEKNINTVHSAYWRTRFIVTSRFIAQKSPEPNHFFINMLIIAAQSRASVPLCAVYWSQSCRLRVLFHASFCALLLVTHSLRPRECTFSCLVGQCHLQGVTPYWRLLTQLLPLSHGPPTLLSQPPVTVPALANKNPPPSFPLPLYSLLPFSFRQRCDQRR